MNPVWAVRDRGWYEVLQALREHPESAGQLAAWDPPGAGITELIDEIHKQCPDGFLLEGQTLDPTASRNPRSTVDMFGLDVVGCEKADLASLELRKTKKMVRAIGQVKAMNALNKATAAATDN